MVSEVDCCCRSIHRV